MAAGMQMQQETTGGELRPGVELMDMGYERQRVMNDKSDGW